MRKSDYFLAMGWRDWLAGQPKAPARSQVQVHALTELLLEGDERVEAVGESHYQPALLRCCGAQRGEEVSYGCRAHLMPEPSNPYDSNAVAVQVDGEHVAYLARTDAARWQPLLLKLSEGGSVAACEAVIAARGARGDTDNLGIFLHLPPIAEARTQLAIRRAQLTG